LAAFHDAAAAGEDLGRLVKGLMDVFPDNSAHPYFMVKGLSLILIRHFLEHDSDGPGMADLLDLPGCECDAAINVCCTWAKEGLDTSCFFPLLISRSAKGLENHYFSCLIAAHVRADPTRWPAVIELYAGQPMGLIECLNESFRRTASRPEEPRPGVDPWLCEQLLTGGREIQMGALGIVSTLVDQGFDLSPVVLQLKGFLRRKRTRDYRDSAAYLLSRHAIRQGDVAHVDLMASHASRDIREGVLRALAFGLHRDQPSNTELLDRIVPFVLDDDEWLSSGALDRLKTVNDRLDIGPSEAAVRPLVPELANKVYREGVAEYLALLIGRDEAWRERIAGWVTEAGVGDAPSAVEILGIRPMAVKCGFCIDLKRGYSTRTSEGHQERIAGMLGPVSLQPSSRGLRRCPECGDWYRFWEWAEDRGYYYGDAEGVALVRLSPADALEHLSGLDLEEWEAGYDERLERSQSGLVHPERSVKKEAAWEVARHCLQMGDPDGLRALLEHHADVVRNEAVHTIRRAQEPTRGGSSQMKYEPLIVDLAPLAELLKPLTKSDDHHVREAAKWLVARADD
jgi:hypothetical protein